MYIKNIEALINEMKDKMLNSVVDKDIISKKKQN